MNDRKKQLETEFEQYEEISSHYSIVCPYCFHEDEEPYEHYSLQRDGDLAEIKCEDCNKNFQVDLDITYTYTSHK